MGGAYLQMFMACPTGGRHILMMFPICMIISCPAAGYLSDKIVKSRKKVLLWGGLLHAFVICHDTINRSNVNSGFVSAFLWYGLSGGAFVSCFACAKELTRHDSPVPQSVR